MQADGYSLDDKRSELSENLVDGENTNNDVPDIINRYNHLEAEKNRSRTDKSFLVSFDDIKNNDWNLSIKGYKKVVYQNVKYDTPRKIIDDIEQLNTERLQALSLLKELLS